MGARARKQKREATPPGPAHPAAATAARSRSPRHSQTPAAPAADELRGGFEGVWVRFLSIFLNFLDTEFCRLAALRQTSGTSAGILRMEVARTFAEALATRLWDAWLAFVSDGAVPTFAAEFAARVTDLLPRLLRRGDAGGRPVIGGFCTEEMMADDLVVAPRRIRGEDVPGARHVIDNDLVHNGVVVSTRSPAPQEGKPRQRITTVLYIVGSDDFPDDLCVAPNRRAVDHRGRADEDAALPNRTRVSFTMCEKTRWVWDWQTREWTTRTETIISRLWPAQ